MPTEALTFTLSAIDAGVGAAFANVDAALAQVLATMGRVDTAARAFDHVEAAISTTAAATDHFASEIDQLDTTLGQTQASLGQVDTAVAHVGKATEAAQAQTAGWSKTWSQVGTGLAAAGTVAAGLVAGLAAMTQQVTSNAVEVDNWATRLGVSVGWMSQMQFGASAVNLDLNGLGEAVAQLSEKLSEAGTGGGDAAAVFARLGVSVLDTAGNVREVDTILPELADGLRGVTNDADRVKLAMQLFGEEGSRLVPVLLQGSGGLEAMQARATALGVTLSDRLAADSRVFQQGLIGVTQALQGTANTVVAAVLPALNDILPKVTDFVVQLKDSTMIQQTLIPLLGGVADAVGWLADKLWMVESVWNAVNTAFNLVISGFMEGVVDWVGGLATLTEAAATAARFLGFEGVASGLDTASATLRTAQAEAQGLANAAAETAAAWWEGNTKIVASTTALVPPLSAAEAAAKATAAAAGSAAAAVSAQWAALGLTIPTALQQASDKALGALTQLAAGGQASAIQLTRGWETTKTAIVAQYGYLPKEFAAVDSAILTGNTALAGQLLAIMGGTTTGIVEDASQIGAAWTVLGLEMPAAMQKGLGEVQTALHTIATNALTPVAQIQTGYEDLRDRTLELYGTLPAGFAQIDAAIAGGNGALVRTLVGQLQTGVDAQVATVPQLVSVWENGHLKIIESGARVPAAAQAANDQLIGQAADAAEAIVPPWQAAHDRITALQDETLALLASSARTVVQEVDQAAASVVTAAGTAVEQLEGMRNFVESQLGPMLEAPLIAFATDLEALQEQQANTIEKMRGLSEATRVISQRSIGFFDHQMGIYQEIMAQLQRKIDALIAGGAIDIVPGARFAAGGLVPGSGPADSVLARVSPGEFLLPPRDVSTMMSLLSQALRPARQSDGGPGAGSTGGSVVHNHPPITVNVAYTGVMNPTMLVRDIREALNEAKRRGDLR